VPDSAHGRPRGRPTSWCGKDVACGRLSFHNRNYNAIRRFASYAVGHAACLVLIKCVIKHKVGQLRWRSTYVGPVGATGADTPSTAVRLRFVLGDRHYNPLPGALCVRDTECQHRAAARYSRRDPMNGGAIATEPFPPVGHPVQCSQADPGYRRIISTRRFCGSRTPGPVGTSRSVCPKPRMEMALAGTPSRTSSPATACARRSERPML
jgi:hypothetical protein